jgi:hypothetical protein
MFSVGYGDITAKTDYELIMAIAWMIIGNGFYTYSVGNLASALSSLESKDAKKQERLTAIHSFCQEAKLPDNIKNQIINF